MGPWPQSSGGSHQSTKMRTVLFRCIRRRFGPVSSNWSNLPLVLASISQIGRPGAVGKVGRSRTSAKGVRNVDETSHEVDLSDLTAVPSGMTPYSQLIHEGRLHSFTINVRPTQPPPNMDGFYVFASNIPHGSTTYDITGAIERLAKPSDVWLFENNSQKSDKARSVKLSSRKNAILRLASRQEYDNLTRPEARLFGVLCKSSGKPNDGERTMFLEPAETKRALIVTDINADWTISQLTTSLHTKLEEDGIHLDALEFTESADSVIGKRYAVLQFPCFPSCFTALKCIESAKCFKAAFTNFRSGWITPQDGGQPYFGETLYLSIYDP
jgi:hypothetical protein